MFFEKENSYYGQDSIILSSNTTPFSSVLKKKSISEKELLDLVIRVQEEERTRMGHELHDGINSLLAIVKLYLECIKGETSKEKFAKEQACSILLTAINGIRNLSSTLIVSQKTDFCLMQLISDLITNVKVLHIFEIQFRCIGEAVLNRICPQRRLMIFRILQEQVNNIIKHSKATHVTVILTCDHKNAILEIADDGIGFDTAKIHNGSGMSNIYARISQFNGIMKIKSSTGNGCELKVFLPYS